MLSNKSFQ